MNDRLKDFLEVYSKAFKESFSKINKVYVAFIVILIRAFFENYRFIGMFGGNMLEGLVNYFLDAALLSFVIQALKSFVVYGNSGKKSIGNSLTNFWQPVLATIFYVYLVEMVLRLIGTGMPYNIYAILLFLFKFAMSALVEEIYINGKTGFEALKQSAKFVCDNILTYGLFTFIFIFIEFYINYVYTYSLPMGLNRAGYVLILGLIETFFYVIRGHLFKYLDHHSYRQRKFMRGY
ncbi:hypothetical protein [uncultured Anaerococcus sp.]|uniref:hypothetical protein n=1 Tax=uncultured Anaerococcus sp. TaxID=293428 RepID=UPI002624D5B4|nr:hypothetical protein [uncultured Anaerococcus sp.]